MIEIVLFLIAGSAILTLAAILHDVGLPRWRERRLRLGNSGARNDCARWDK